MRFFEGSKVNQVNSPKRKERGKRNPKTEEKVNPRKAELNKYESVVKCSN